MKIETIDIYEAMVEKRDLSNLKATDEQLMKYVKEELDFYHLEFGINTAVYYCGILTAVPFDELAETDMSEEDILNHFKDHHLKVEGKVLSFQYNPESPINDFLLKYKKDGYGWNVPSGIDQTFEVIERELRGYFDTLDDDEDFEYEEEDL